MLLFFGGWQEAYGGTFDREDAVGKSGGVGLPIRGICGLEESCRRPRGALRSRGYLICSLPFRVGLPFTQPASNRVAQARVSCAQPIALLFALLCYALLFKISVPGILVLVRVRRGGDHFFFKKQGQPLTYNRQLW